MKIGELAKRSGCSVQAIRYYEKEGLIPLAPRTEGNFRLYGSPALEKLSFIKNCRALDLTLGEIKHLISLQNSPGKPCESVNEMIDTHLQIVETRINELVNLQCDLSRLRHKCEKSRSIDQCGILNELSPKSP
ncbi:MAG: Cd(II)/Pb(II)-responsive transcriptional regulator [Pseudomonadales bacterium]